MGTLPLYRGGSFMPNFSPTQENYRDLAQALAKFTSLTQIKTLCYGFNGILLKNNLVFLNDSAIRSNLADEDLTSFALFPISWENQLWGLMLCDASSVSQKRLELARTYLTDVLHQAFAQADVPIQVWEPLKPNQIKQLNYFNHLMFPANSHPRSTSADFTMATAMIDGQPISNDDAYQSIKLAVAYIHQHIQHALSLHEVAEAAYLSPSYLSRLFKKYLHVSFVEYVNNQKIALAQEQLALTFIPINQISAQLGFAQTSYFTKIFKRKTHLTPSEFRQRNHAIQKVYTIPRDLDWQSSDSVYDVTRNYFKRRDIIYRSDTDDGTTYVTQIGDLTDSAGTRGWVFTVDGQQLLQSVDEVSVQNKSVIQWVYMNYAH